MNTLRCFHSALLVHMHGLFKMGAIGLALLMANVGEGQSRIYDRVDVGPGVLPPRAGERLVAGILDPGPTARIAYGHGTYSGADSTQQFIGRYFVRALDGQLLHMQAGTSGGQRLGSSVAVHKDLTGDGWDDLSIGSGGLTGLGVDGQSFQTFHVFVRGAAPLGDLDGDGLGDLYCGQRGLVFGNDLNGPGMPFTSSRLYDYPSWAQPGSPPFSPGWSRLLAFDDRDGVVFGKC
ncbi:MAG: hypothetical protein WD226_05240 [Planctomycetota bacterium]